MCLSSFSRSSKFMLNLPKLRQLWSIKTPSKTTSPSFLKINMKILVQKLKRGQKIPPPIISKTIKMTLEEGILHPIRKSRWSVIAYGKNTLKSEAMRATRSTYFSLLLRIIHCFARYSLKIEWSIFYHYSLLQPKFVFRTYFGPLNGSFGRFGKFQSSPSRDKPNILMYDHL